MQSSSFQGCCGINRAGDERETVPLLSTLTRAERTVSSLSSDDKYRSNTLTGSSFTQLQRELLAFLNCYSRRLLQRCFFPLETQSDSHTWCINLLRCRFSSLAPKVDSGTVPRFAQGEALTIASAFTRKRSLSHLF